MSVLPNQVTWHIAGQARAAVAAIRKRVSAAAYAENREALQIFLCNYFNSAPGAECREKQGKSINPIHCPIDGAKALKVRWMRPGNRGKREELRLAVLLYCDRRVVKIVGCWMRDTDPTDDELDSTLKAAPLVPGRSK